MTDVSTIGRGLLGRRLQRPALLAPAPALLRSVPALEEVAVRVRGGETHAARRRAGERVEELPATWRDRTAGESRFRLMALYLRWYLWALRKRWLG